MDGEGETGITYPELGALADTILEECDDDPAALSARLDRLSEPVRDGLLSSDFLNAYQVFYFYFREVPAEIEMERLILVPASELQYGIRINEIELLDLLFAVAERVPVIVVSDGDKALARYTGNTAYRNGLRYIESTL